jgi:hypothetical protein
MPVSRNDESPGTVARPEIAAVVSSEQDQPGGLPDLEASRRQAEQVARPGAGRVQDVPGTPPGAPLS